jgi:glycosyltransferase involved in cell wall biosynthesis
MQLSLVICTRNRASQLAESLRSLTKLQYPGPWELVIVDNGSKDETQDVINDFRATLLLKAAVKSNQIFTEIPSKPAKITRWERRRVQCGLGGLALQRKIAGSPRPSAYSSSSAQRNET